MNSWFFFNVEGFKSLSLKLNRLPRTNNLKDSSNISLKVPVSHHNT